MNATSYQVLREFLEGEIEFEQLCLDECAEALTEAVAVGDADSIESADEAYKSRCTRIFRYQQLLRLVNACAFREAVPGR